jgi:predicted alpha/beta superfamily hydrolase
VADPLLFPGSGGPAAPCIYVVCGDGEWEDLGELTQGRTCAIVQTRDADFFRDFSPWPEAALTPDIPAFAGGAPAYLRTLVTTTIPAIERAHGLAPRTRAICGYSLAGLFALYALLESDAFCAAACVSGSLWFEGWPDYLARAVARPAWRDRCANPATRPYAFFTLGNKERNAPNPRMRTVRMRTDETVDALLRSGAEAEFQRMPGTHFTFVDERIGEGLSHLDTHLMQHATRLSSS